MDNSTVDASDSSSEEGDITHNREDSEDASKSLPGLNIKSKSVDSILMESCLTKNVQKELKDLFINLKSETNKIEGSEAVKLKLSIQLFEKVINSRNLGSKNSKQLMDLIMIESLQVNSLVKLLRKCLEEIRKENTETFDCWLSVIGRILSTIQIIETFKLEDEDGKLVSGQDFVSRAVLDICSLNWNSEIGTSMCSMLKALTLSPAVQTEVFTKLCEILKSMNPDSIPPLVLQLTEFSKNSSQFSRTLLDTINCLFSSKLRPEGRERRERNVDLDSIELVGGSTELVSLEQLIQAEGTVIFHLSQACKVNHTICREVMEMVTAGGSAPEIVLTPFCLFLALSMISIKHCQVKILTGLKTSIMKSIFIEDSRQDNEWLRLEAVMKSEAHDVGDLFSVVISQCRQAGGFELILEGLQSLGLELLDVTPRTRAELARVKTLHNIGGRLLIKLIKKMPEMARGVLPLLINKILLNPTCLQYTEALRIIISECATILMEKPNCLTSLLDNLSRLSYNIARRALLALLPLFKLSRVTRDSLIIVLRKLLFSPKVSCRQAATAGVLLMLRTVRIPGSRCLSQTMSQSSGSLSQMAVDVHRGRSSPNAESVCLELLGALRRCFSQQCEVKVVLYTGIVDTVNTNSQLCEGAVDLLYSHLLSLWGTEGSSRNRWQLKLERIFKESEDHWVLEDPLGWFVSCLQQLVGKAQQVLGDESDSLARIIALLDEMVEKYGKCEAGELGFDEHDSFDRRTMLGAKKICQVEQLQGMLEALMEYVYTRGADHEEEKARQLIRLFNVHNSLSQVVEASEKRGKTKKGEKIKKGGKKDKADTLDISEGGDESPRKAEYQPPLHCITLKCLSLMINTLLIDRTEENQSAVLLLRSNTEFLTFVLETLEKKLKQISDNLKINGDEEKTSSSEFRYLTNISHTLFSHCVVTREPVQAALTLTTSLLDLNLSVLLLFTRRRRMALASLTMQELEPGVGGNINTVILPAVKHLQAKIEFYKGRLEDPDEDDIPVMMAQCVGVLRSLIEEMVDDVGLEEAAEIVKEMIADPPEDDSVLKPVISLILYMKTKTDAKGTDDYLRDLCKRMHFLAGDLDETVVLERHGRFSWLVDDNKYQVLPIIFTSLDNNLSQVDTVLSWVKSLSSYSVTSEETISQAEKSLCIHLAHQINSFSELVKTALPLDVTDGLIKLLTKLYSIMGTLTKHFLVRLRLSKTVVRKAKFDTVIRHMDKNLSKYVHQLQNYIEESKEKREKEIVEKKNAKRKAVDSNQAGLKIIRDSKGVTNLILKMEIMYMDLTKLGKKIGEKLIEGYKFHNRDFKFKMEKLRELEDSDEDDESEDDQNNDDNNHEVSENQTPGHHSIVMAEEAADSIVDTEPVKKKRKLYSSANLLANSS